MSDVDTDELRRSLRNIPGFPKFKERAGEAFDLVDAQRKDHEEIVEASLQWQALAKEQRKRLDKLEAFVKWAKRDKDRGFLTGTTSMLEALAAIEEKPTHRIVEYLTDGVRLEEIEEE